MKNHFWNVLTTIKNGQLSKNSLVNIDKTKRIETILKILWLEGFINGYQIKSLKKITIFLKYIEEQPVITSLIFISRPGKKIYFSAKQIFNINSSKHFIIFSTNKGIKSIHDCKKLNLGGEPLILVK